MSELQKSIAEYNARKMSLNDMPDGIELEIRMERARQDAKFGVQNLDPFKYLAILGEEVGEVNKAAVESFHFQSGNFNLKGLEDYRMELIQVAATAKAMIETLDRDEWRKKR
jgi:NTP pyrophosphatase (non-canonical NTP hydrolase)